MEVLGEMKKKTKTKQNYLHTMLVIYMENDKGNLNGLNIHIYWSQFVMKGL